MDAVQGDREKYFEPYNGTVKNIFRWATQKCAISESSNLLVADGV